MRIFTLFILLYSGLMLPSLTAQSQLPASLEPYQADFSPTVSAALARHFPAPVTPAKTVDFAKSLDADMFLDSTITYEPSSDGGDDPDLAPVSKTIFTQPEVNVSVARTFDLDGDMWAPVSESTTTEDELGREYLIQQAVYDADLETWFDFLRIRNFYRGSSLEILDSLYIDVYNEDSDSWESLLAQNNTFDDEERLIESMVTTSLFSLEDPLVIVDTYSYNEAGDNDLILTSIIDGTDRIPAGRTERTYNDHLVTEELSYVTDDEGAFIPDQRLTINYTGQELQDSIVTYVWDDQADDWVIESVDDFDYDGSFITDYFTTSFTMGEPDYMTRQNTTYLPGMEYVKEIQYFDYDFTTETYDLTESTTYFYSEVTTTSLPSAAAQETLRIWPNPVVNTLRINFEEPAVLHLSDHSGRLLLVRQYEPGHDVDLGTLPSGVYIISLTTSKARHQARVVKG